MAQGLVKNSLAAIILAAGKGTRMKSEMAKVLHSLAGKPMILHVIDAAMGVVENIIVVVGTQAREVKSVVGSHSNISFAYQSQQLGTGHAVLCAIPQLDESSKHILILCGDVPLITRSTLNNLMDVHLKNANDLTVLGAVVDTPYGYGRIKQKGDGSVRCIVEETDATAEEKKITTVNTGIYCVEKTFLKKAIFSIQTDNAQGEMYLTDIVGIAANEHRSVGLSICSNNDEMVGINSQDDLKTAEALMALK